MVNIPWGHTDLRYWRRTSFLLLWDLFRMWYPWCEHAPEGRRDRAIHFASDQRERATRL